MITYQLGSKGPEVVRVQRRLLDLGFAPGRADGAFGGATEAAVRAFQRSRSLAEDGVVRAETWSALFEGETIAEPVIKQAPLVQRVLALTGGFETGRAAPECFAGLSGDFDGQGISFGVLQWNFGQGSLQPLLHEMDAGHPDTIDAIFAGSASVLRAMLAGDRKEQLAWARSVQGPQKIVHEPWRGRFRALGSQAAFQDIEVRHARSTFERALSLCRSFGVRSERAAALLFDICVQNGGIRPEVRGQIEKDFSGLPEVPGGDDDAEVGRLAIIAERRSAAAKPEWVADVRARKMTIALGRGTVHGSTYDLEGQYGIGLRTADSL